MITDEPGQTENAHDAETTDGDGFQPASVQIANGVREMILSGGLAPGARIGQAKLASDYGVSRIPVREALRQLANEGLVVHVPNAGARVSELSLPETLEIYRLREAIEPTLVSQAAIHVTEEEKGGLRASMERLEKSRDWLTWLLEDRIFHLGTFRAARMPTGLALAERFYNQTQPFRRHYFGSLRESEMEVVHMEHRLILNAIERQDPVDAEVLQRSHIRRTRLELMREPELSDDSAQDEPRGQRS